VKVEICCEYQELVNPRKLVDHPRNNNRHPIEQIEKFANIMKSIKKWRYPIVVSKRSGFIISGHGRKQMALVAEIEEVPVVYQNYDSEAEEVQQLTLDNEIQRWTELDRQAVYLALEELPELKIDLLGIESFQVLNIEEDELPDLGDGSDNDIKQMTFTVSTGQANIIEDAIKKIKTESECHDEINENSNGNALAEIMRRYVNS